MGVFDVPTSDLISHMAEDLKTKIEKPEWSDYVKTAPAREKAPENRDWIYVRMASILYRVYSDGETGVGSLRSYYGGKKRNGVKKSHHRKASGKVIRFCMQALEKEGLLEKAKTGRKVSPKGQSFLEKNSKAVKAKKPKPVNNEVKEAKPEKKEAKQEVKTEAKVAEPKQEVKPEKKPEAKQGPKQEAKPQEKEKPVEKQEKEAK